MEHLCCISQLKGTQLSMCGPILKVRLGDGRERGHDMLEEEETLMQCLFNVRFTFMVSTWPHKPIPILLKWVQTNHCEDFYQKSLLGVCCSNSTEEVRNQNTTRKIEDQCANTFNIKLFILF